MIQLRRSRITEDDREIQGLIWSFKYFLYNGNFVVHIGVLYSELLPKVNLVVDDVTDFYDVFRESNAVGLFARTRVLISQAGLK